jgi:L-threonylcarbamoyladenylate synthase
MKIIKLDNNNLEETVKIAGEFIKEGKAVVCPTDTVYGLVCDATNKKAVEKIFTIKDRPKDKPLPIFVKDIVMAKELAEINEEQEIFLKKSWPGNVTVILSRRGAGPELFGADKKTIGLRVPDFELILNIIKEFGLPLAETSVNISGELPMNDIKKIIETFSQKEAQPDLVIDAGDLGEANPSQIVDLTSEKPKIIRE